jgi:DNA-binding NtrC family response regulator
MMADEQTILVVDDERDVRELLALVLQSAGYAVIIAANSREVLDILATRQVALLITDYHMPEMNGTELIARVRAAHPRLPMILASGERSLEALAASCGANGYYEKGMPLTHLLTLVAAMLQESVRQNGDESDDRGRHEK